MKTTVKLSQHQTEVLAKDMRNGQLGYGSTNNTLVLKTAAGLTGLVYPYYFWSQEHCERFNYRVHVIPIGSQVNLEQD